MTQDILNLIGDCLRRAEIELDESLTRDQLAGLSLEQLGADSLKVLEALMHLEEALGVESPIEEHADSTTLREIADHYVSLVAEDGEGGA